MKNNGHVPRGRRFMDYALAAMEQLELYCEAHPGSPAAVRRPRLFVRGDLWIALLGPRVEEGISGLDLLSPQRYGRSTRNILLDCERPPRRLAAIEQCAKRPLQWPDPILKEGMQIAETSRHNRC
jgi:hypothetical protein